MMSYATVQEADHWNKYNPEIVSPKIREHEYCYLLVKYGLKVQYCRTGNGLGCWYNCMRKYSYLAYSSCECYVIQ